MARSVFGKESRASFEHKLQQIITQSGGQKKAAKKFGVSERTIRRWLKGDTNPKPDQVKKVNRSYGQIKNRTAIKPAQKPTSFAGLNVMNLESWIRTYHPSFAEKMMKYIPNSGKSWARYLNSDPTVAQWLSDAELSEPYTGKPPNARGVRIIVVETDYYNPELTNVYSRRESFRTGNKNEMSFKDTRTELEQRYYSVPVKRKKGKKIKPGQTLVQEMVSFFFGGGRYVWDKN